MAEKVQTPEIASLPRKMLRALFRMASIGVMGVIIIPLLYLIEPFWRIRIIHFGVDRIGNFSEDIQLYWAKRELGRKPERTTEILLGGNPCNRQLMTMWKRLLPICDSRWVSRFWHHTKHLLQKTWFDSYVYQTFDDHEEFAYGQPVIRFTPAEAERGTAILRQIGIGENDWYVAFHCRDSAFARARFPKLPADQVDKKARFRNTDIADYFPAAETIVARGGFAVRVGAVVENALPDTLPARVVDYSSRFQSDFGDIYVSSNCRFFLTSPSGLASVPAQAGIPIAMASHIPLFPLPYNDKSLISPMLLRWKDDGRLVTFAEADKIGMFGIPPNRIWNFTDDFDEVGIVPTHSTPDDIVDLTLDMLDRLNGVAPPKEAVELQRAFEERYLPHITSRAFAPKLSPRFLMKYPHLVEA